MNSNKVRELTEDYIFKRVFGKKGNEDILKDLLESILEIKIEQIEVIVGSEIEKEKIKEKIGIIDLKATINKETTVDIEIQVKDYHNMIERSTFYIAGLYHTGLKRGERYEKNNKVIGINILMFNIFKWKKFHSKGILKENELNEIMTDKLELHFLELPKIIKNSEEGNKRLRQWLEFIYNKRKGEIEMAVKENEKIAKAQVEYKYLTGDERVQRLAFLRDKWESDHKSELNWVKIEAEKRGEKRGEAKGERKKQKQIVKELLKAEVQDEIIIKTTQISKEELEKMKEEVKN
ncbi:MAG TPA: Rpn family recombination-promoting nuclease/putative transposase [Clostridiaceae bacterium]|nr:Rpn family recombination-promoting nuclease/putative transposase [Clostridium sp.]HJJ11883.1 Rpn family recombination-promoting nuclease/putative transposase [Clostridiaceae bacterium]